MDVRLGIDFGTANTVAVISLPDREPRPLLFDGSPLLPSAVCADGSGRMIVGRDALHTGVAEPASFEQATVAALRTAGVDAGDVAAVFLTGGSSRMPAVATVLHRTLGITPTVVDDPELSVAEGSIRTGAEAAGTSPDWPAGPAAIPVPPPARRGRRPAVWAAALATVVAVATVAVVLSNRPSGGDGTDTTRGTGASPSAAAASPSPRASPSLASWLDPCLVGTWRKTSGTRLNKIYDSEVAFNGGAGQLDTYRADGTAVVNFSAAAPYYATVRGARWKEVIKGKATLRYKAVGGVLTFTRPIAQGTWALYRNGRHDNGGNLSLSPEPVRYVCSGRTVTATTSHFTSEYVKVG